MPNQKVDYSKTEIYKLIHNSDIDNKNIYIGSTTNFRQRKCRHKSDCNNEKSKKYNIKVYTNIRSNGGWEEWNMLLVEKYKCIDKNESLVRERHWIDFYKSKLNMKTPSRSQKEYILDNKEKIKEYLKKYNQINKKEVKEKDKIKYQKNKVKISEQSKIKYEKHKQEINEKRKVKITCECGCFIRKDSLLVHKKSKRHLDLMSTKII